MEKINSGVLLCIVGNIVSVVGVVISGDLICLLGNFMSLIGIAMFSASFRDMWKLMRIQDEMIFRMEKMNEVVMEKKKDEDGVQ